jgi:hypothetical protein
LPKREQKQRREKRQTPKTRAPPQMISRKSSNGHIDDFDEAEF